MGEEPGPIDAAPVLAAVEARLVELLGALRAEEWELPTAVPGWSVRDVVCHLLDTHLRKLTVSRDGWMPVRPDIRSAADLAAFVDGLNADGVAFYRKLSGPVLTRLMEAASAESVRWHASLDPQATAAFAVSWAGETESRQWMDTARELTERWHHQQQIREATSREGILTPELYRPVLDAFFRALPFHYRDVAAAEGTVINCTVRGVAGGTWWLQRGAEAWQLVTTVEDAPSAVVVLPPEIAWKVFTKGVSRDAARAASVITGDERLGAHLLTMVAIVAAPRAD